MRKSKNGISVFPIEYGSMDANARELAASFDLEKLTGEFYADPYPTYRALREHEPVKRMPNGSWFLTRYDDLVSAYKSTKVFSSDKKKEFAPKYGASLLYEHHTTSLVFNDPPAHTRVRRLIMGALSPRAIAEMEPYVVALVDRLLDAIAAKGDSELIGDFASAIPIVFSGSSDAVGLGIVKSLSQPGGNITGISHFNVSLAGKRLENLRELYRGWERWAAELAESHTTYLPLVRFRSPKPLGEKAGLIADRRR